MLVFDPRKAMRNVTHEGIAASVMFAITNTFLAVFAAALGASNTQIGMVVAVPAVVALASYMPAAYAIERWNRRRAVCVASSFISRFLWVLVGAIPFLLLWGVVSTPWHSVALLITIVSAYSLFSTFIGPAWASMVGMIVPDRIRGSYFGRRNQLCAVASLIAGTAAGLALQVFNSMFGFAAIFVAAGIAGVISSFFFSRFPDIRFEPEKVLILSELRAAFRNRGFRIFIIIFMVWQFGVFMSAPFMNVYLIEGLRAEYIWLSAVVIAAGVSTIAVQGGWGRVSDIFGHRSILVISAFGASFIPVLWTIAPSPEFSIPINIISGASWAGFNLAVFNYLLEISTGGKRTIYTAVYWTLGGIPNIIAPVVGGMLADVLMPVPLYHLNGFRGMFLVSWVIRMAAAAMFAYFLVEVPPRKRVSTRHIAREIVGIGFHAIDRPFHLIRKRSFGYVRWLAMGTLSEVKKLEGLPRSARREILAAEHAIKEMEEREEREWRAILNRLRRILGRFRDRGTG